MKPIDRFICKPVTQLDYDSFQDHIIYLDREKGLALPEDENLINVSHVYYLPENGWYFVKYGDPSQQQGFNYFALIFNEDILSNDLDEVAAWFMERANEELKHYTP